MQKANTSKTNENIPTRSNEESRQNSSEKTCEYCGKPYKEYFDKFSNKTFMISNCNCGRKLEQKQKGLETIALIRSIRNNSGIGKRYLKKTFSN